MALWPLQPSTKPLPSCQPPHSLYSEDTVLLVLSRTFQLLPTSGPLHLLCWLLNTPSPHFPGLGSEMPSTISQTRPNPLEAFRAQRTFPCSDPVPPLRGLGEHLIMVLPPFSPLLPHRCTIYREGRVILHGPSRACPRVWFTIFAE